MSISFPSVTWLYAAPSIISAPANDRVFNGESYEGMFQISRWQEFQMQIFVKGKNAVGIHALLLDDPCEVNW